MPPRSLDAMLRHAHHAAECSSTNPTDPRTTGAECEKRPGTCGVLLPGLSNGIPTTGQVKLTNQNVLPYISTMATSIFMCSHAPHPNHSSPH